NASALSKARFTSAGSIKSENMIDPAEVKRALDSADAFPPPLKIVRAHSLPAKKRDPPALAPLLRERIVFEVRLGRRATEPVQHEFVWPRKDVGAAIADSEWNIAH